jgi:hypothetical protein
MAFNSVLSSAGRWPSEGWLYQTGHSPFRIAVTPRRPSVLKVERRKGSEAESSLISGSG